MVYKNKQIEKEHTDEYRARPKVIKRQNIYQRKYRETHKEEAKAYYQSHKEESKVYYLKHKKRILKAQKVYMDKKRAERDRLKNKSKIMEKEEKKWNKHKN